MDCKAFRLAQPRQTKSTPKVPQLDPLLPCTLNQLYQDILTPGSALTGTLPMSFRPIATMFSNPCGVGIC